MNRMIGFRFAFISSFLLLPICLSGCALVCVPICQVVCAPPPGGGGSLLNGICFLLCWDMCDPTFGDDHEFGLLSDYESQHFCNDTPDKCAATYEHFQLAAIEFCEEYPEECQEYFDAYLESFAEEATE